MRLSFANIILGWQYITAYYGLSLGSTAWHYLIIWCVTVAGTCPCYWNQLWIRWVPILTYTFFSVPHSNWDAHIIRPLLFSMLFSSFKQVFIMLNTGTESMNQTDRQEEVSTRWGSILPTFVEINFKYKLAAHFIVGLAYGMCILFRAVCTCK